MSFEDSEADASKTKSKGSSAPALVLGARESLAFSGAGIPIPKPAAHGIRAILDARRIVLLAFGENKAPVVAKAAEGPMTSALPASYGESVVMRILDPEALMVELSKLGFPCLELKSF